MRLTDGISPLRSRLRAVKLNMRHQMRRHPESPFRGALSAMLQLVGLRVRAARVWLTDHQVMVLFDLQRGLREADIPRESSDIELSSAALAYSLRFLWEVKVFR